MQLEAPFDDNTEVLFRGARTNKQGVLTQGGARGSDRQRTSANGAKRFEASRRPTRIKAVSWGRQEAFPSASMAFGTGCHDCDRSVSDNYADEKGATLDSV